MVIIMNETVCVVGLGYVGLPLAVAFGKAGYNVIGFDVNQKRIQELKNYFDSSLETSSSDLIDSKVEFTNDSLNIKRAEFVIVCVPTPINKNKNPDLKYLESASEIVGKNLQLGSIIVYESTVFPGVTEEVCLPILEKFSGLKCPDDFKIGYSPERINPGDKEHTIDKIVKVVSSIDEESLNKLSKLYSNITKAGVFLARSIKTAEAAKVIENIQRDLNIALMNELSLIFNKLNIDTKSVLEAAQTKWNFHKYTPGLVGGHCIGVDPYYLTFKAEELGFHPKVILAGRATNDSMSKHVCELVIKGLNSAGKVLRNSKVLVLGLTFKEDVRDARNSKALDVINELRAYGMSIVAYEPNLDPLLIQSIFNVEPVVIDSVFDVDCVVVINRHKSFESINLDKIKSISSINPVIVDIKHFFNADEAIQKGFIFRSL